MTNEERNAALLQKMQGEQEQYRKWLLAQTPEEILSHTFEYTVRQDVLAEMEALKLCDEQADALLRSESPLADVYKTFRNMDTEYMDVITAALRTGPSPISSGSGNSGKPCGICRSTVILPSMPANMGRWTLTVPPTRPMLPARRP